MIGRALICAVLLCGARPKVAASQAHPHSCFWPAPPAQCSSWFVTELGVHARLTDVVPGDERVLFAYAVGWMRSVAPRSAFGVEAFGGAEGEVRGGVAIRARRWTAPRTAVDAALGVHLFGDASGQDVVAGSPMLQLRMTYADKAAVAARVDLLKLRCALNCYPMLVQHANGTSARLYVGGEVGSQVGVLGMVLTAVLIAIAAAAYSGID